MSRWTVALALPLLAAGLAGEAGQQAPASRISVAAAAALTLVPGAGPVHVEADDQDGNRIGPGLFSWVIPAGAAIGVQEDATGWQLTAPVGAPPGNFSILVQYNPNPSLSPTVSLAVGNPITGIRIVVSPSQ